MSNHFIAINSIDCHACKWFWTLMENPVGPSFIQPPGKNCRFCTFSKVLFRWTPSEQGPLYRQPRKLVCAVLTYSINHIKEDDRSSRADLLCDRETEHPKLARPQTGPPFDALRVWDLYRSANILLRTETPQTKIYVRHMSAYIIRGASVRPLR